MLVVHTSVPQPPGRAELMANSPVTLRENASISPGCAEASRLEPSIKAVIGRMDLSFIIFLFFVDTIFFRAKRGTGRPLQSVSVLRPFSYQLMVAKSSGFSKASM